MPRFYLLILTNKPKFIKKYQWIEAQLKENRLHIQTTASLFHNGIKLDGLQVQINMSGGIQLNITSLDKFNSTSELYNAIQNCDICSQTRENILVNFNDDTQACAKIIFSLAKLRKSTFDSINTKYIIETDIDTYIAQYYKIRFDSNVNYIDKELNDNNLITRLQYLRKRYPKRSFPSANQNQSKPKINIDWRKIISKLKINIDWRKIIFVPIFLLATICCAIIFCEKSEIHYTTPNGNKIEFNEDLFDNFLLCHKYKDGQGTIVFYGEVTAIPERAFEGTSISSIEIPESISTIGNCAFQNCESLESISIPNGVTSIEDQTFLGCMALKKVVIPESVTTIGRNSFQACRSLERITLPNSVTTIGEVAFYGCTNLKEITLSNNLTSIERNTFGCCTELKSVTIPNSVLSIGDNAFAECHLLSEVVVGSGVQSIGAKAFYRCESLSEIVLPNSVTNVGSNSFEENRALQKVVLSSGIKSINEKTFYCCTALTDITIPNGIERISSNALSCCSSLINVVIPQSVTSISDNAFHYCIELDNVVIKNEDIKVLRKTFDHCIELSHITIGEDKIDVDWSCYSDDLIFTRDIDFTNQKARERYIAWMTEDRLVNSGEFGSLSMTLSNGMPSSLYHSDGGFFKVCTDFDFSRNEINFKVIDLDFLGNGLRLSYPVWITNSGCLCMNIGGEIICFNSKYI